MTTFELPEDTSLLPLRPGENHLLEQKAAELLAKGREGVTALRDKRDYLTKDQLLLRYSHEVSNGHGFCDESLMSGLFKRAYNPTFGHRPGHHSQEEG
jgi:hypothetical protein